MLSAVLQRQLATVADGPIAVAFSSGLDSTVLLHALAHAPAARARGLRAIHIDHGLHGDSRRWSEHCAHVAQTLGVALTRHAVVVARDSGSGLEDAARQARLAAFAELLRDGELLALAQHRDDQAETILLKLLRGAGPEGLGGVRGLRAFAHGYLWRPLLDLPRSALRSYAQEHELSWIEDSSNADTRLRRNFLRHQILPQLGERWPEASAALAHSANWARAAADFIAEQARLALARIQGLDPATLRWREWLALADALRDPVLRLWLRGLGLDEPAHFHVAELERQLRAAADRTPHVAFGNSQLRRYRDMLYAMPTLPDVPRDWTTDWNGTPIALPGGGRLTLEPMRSDVSLRLRYRIGGERLRLAGYPHTRELRTLYQESGIPPWLRERIPLICAGADLLAAGDLVLSDAGQRWCETHGVRFAFAS